MSGRLIMGGKAIVNRMSRRHFGRTTILAAGLSMGIQPMSGSLIVRVETVLRRLMIRV
jgi:ABC-type nickel/cobalt efflux system permease component RcnA